MRCRASRMMASTVCGHTSVPAFDNTSLPIVSSSAQAHVRITAACVGITVPFVVFYRVPTQGSSATQVIHNPVSLLWSAALHPHPFCALKNHLQDACCYLSCGSHWRFPSNPFGRHPWLWPRICVSSSPKHAAHSLFESDSRSRHAFPPTQHVCGMEHTLS
ncbi:hypothetical protein T440DRAFT_525802 [Plenodomus tracheiphilus IPT5]|uniref:Uncharacterized protein n=1 Tax=Plenodomus tracheiphilus IPT5 TaxID=1408161 RepID=A0A6A7AQ09_9PLEO|nr:hypothetical protein T440DRAFT_525802 [Plenodomus tracheiphilus IPT5]